MFVSVLHGRREQSQTRWKRLVCTVYWNLCVANYVRLFRRSDRLQLREFRNARCDSLKIQHRRQQLPRFLYPLFLLSMCNCARDTRTQLPNGASPRAHVLKSCSALNRRSIHFPKSNEPHYSFSKRRRRTASSFLSMYILIQILYAQGRKRRFNGSNFPRSKPAHTTFQVFQPV